ncbi:hypothetical protein C2E23DRAFT_48482 [Lenzites betulinus]|nr:hypothetical protein C2E23DRAFT_48482 [Lenzites betulinus]
MKPPPSSGTLAADMLLIFAVIGRAPVTRCKRSYRRLFSASWNAGGVVPPLQHGDSAAAPHLRRRPATLAAHRPAYQLTTLLIDGLSCAHAVVSVVYALILGALKLKGCRGGTYLRLQMSKIRITIAHTGS